MDEWVRWFYDADYSAQMFVVLACWTNHCQSSVAAIRQYTPAMDVLPRQKDVHPKPNFVINNRTEMPALFYLPPHQHHSQAASDLVDRPDRVHMLARWSHWPVLDYPTSRNDVPLLLHEPRIATWN
jgi:hypothetical protein